MGIIQNTYDLLSDLKSQNHEMVPIVNLGKVLQTLTTSSLFHITYFVSSNGFADGFYTCMGWACFFDYS